MDLLVLLSEESVLTTVDELRERVLSLRRER